jgi:hypothetical protein
MKTFKERIRSDVENVFLNADEFAREIDIDGKTILAVVDDSHAPFSGGRADGLADASGLGLLEQTRVLFIRDAEVSVIPEQRVLLDGEAWIAAAVAVEDGMLKVTLTRGYA